MALLLQLLANGLVSGSGWALVAIGFGLVFRVTGVFHFAHGSVYAAAAYLAYAAIADFGLPWPVAFVLATVGAVLLGCAMERLVYRPLREHGAPSFVMLVASLGAGIFVNNSFALVWSSQVRSVTVAGGPGYALGPVVLSGVQVATVVTAAVVMGGLFVFLTRSRLGLAMRALANSPFMTRIVGIPVRRVRLLTFALGSLVAAPAGILALLDTGARPDMGAAVMLIAAIAVFVGGIGSLPGAALAALVIGLLVNLGVWQWSARWQDAIVAGVLLLFMVLRPRGLFGLKQSQAEV